MSLISSIKKKLEELDEERSPTPEVISFQTIRRSVGWLGILLPFSLAAGSLLHQPECWIQPSISHYYFTNMREVFVGVLCAVSLFLFTYKGHTRLDGIASNVAGLLCLGVALFPTNIINGYACQENVVSFISIDFHSAIHFTCAGLFFLTLSLISLFLFTKSKFTKKNQTQEKKSRNIVYKWCGGIMLVCIAVIGINSMLNQDETGHLVFWLETLALISFGVSWLTKGETLLGDKIAGR